MNSLRWSAVVLFVIVLVSVGVAIAAPWTSRDEPARRSPTPLASEPTPSVSVAPTAALGDRELRASSFVGPVYDRNLVSDPTRPTTQARLWFHDGSWWAMLVSERTNQVSIHELNWDSQRWVDTGVPVDARPIARQDVLRVGSKLYVVGAGTRNSSSHALRVSRFAYDRSDRRYVLEPDSPQLLTTTGVEDPTLAMGPDGQIWLSYVWSRVLYASHTTGDGNTWVTPFPVPAEDDSVERAAMVPTGDGVAIAWTGLETNTLHLARHVSGTPDDVWEADSTTVDGLAYGEDELSARATTDGAVLVVVRTSLDQVENRNLDAPLLVLAQSSDGEWTQTVVSRVRDGLSGPSLLVDEAHDDVYVFAEAGGGVYGKLASLEAPLFVPGRGALVIEPAEPLPVPSPSDGTPGESPAPPDPELTGTTSTRQALDGLSEIVLLASDDVSSRYGHAVVPLEGGRDAPAAEGQLGPLPEGVVEGLPPGAVAYVFRDSFTPYEPGPGARSGWLTRDEPADELVTIAEPAPGDPSLRVSSDPAGDGPRACKPVASTSSGNVVIRAAVQVRGTLDGDATVTALRSDGEEVAAVRFGGEGTLRYFVGDERITTAIAYTLGIWYQSIVTVDLDTQSYGWQLTPIGAQAPVLSVDGLPLRGPAPFIDEVCVQAADAAPGGATELFVDDVIAAIGPGE